jgi:hypothetical protein
MNNRTCAFIYKKKLHNNWKSKRKIPSGHIRIKLVFVKNIPVYGGDKTKILKWHHSQADLIWPDGTVPFMVILCDYVICKYLNTIVTINAR